MSEILPRLLAPLNPDEFFSSYWGRRYCHLQRPGTTTCEWLTTEDIDTLFQSQSLPAASVNIFSEGKPIPIEDWSLERTSDRGCYRALDIERMFGCYRDGATVILNQAQFYVPRLSEACRLLTHELGFRVSSNVYITPPGSAGFVRHHDDHEVLILQTIGSKLWTVYQNDGVEAVELRLGTNDLLYLPRGTDHAARAGSKEASVHVTFGMFPPYGFNLVEQLATLAQQDPIFKNAMPPASIESASDIGFQKEFAARILTLFEENGIAGLIAGCYRQVAKNQSLGWPGRFSEHLALGDISGQTVVSLRRGILFTTIKSQGSIEVHFAGRTIRFPLFLESCLKQLSNGTPVAIQDLAGLISEAGKIEFVQSLVKSGFLEILSQN